MLAAAGCATAPGLLTVTGLSTPFKVGTIIDTASGRAIGVDALIADLGRVPVVYVGETHTNPAHHEVQLEILKGLYAAHPSRVVVGMEMFDRTYQPVLDQWVAGKLTWERFLELSHWYANWRYPDRLYRPILEFVRDHHIPLFGLNIPYWIPSNIAVGGIGSLRPEERRQLPAHIDTSNAAHRAFVHKIFMRHHIPGYNHFKYFYEAQCVWEDVMAETIARHLTDDRLMVVFAGNGHIQHDYGIPDRARARTGKPFLTVSPVSPGTKIDAHAANFLWVTPSMGMRGHF